MIKSPRRRWACGRCYARLYEADVAAYVKRYADGAELITMGTMRLRAVDWVQVRPSARSPKLASYLSRIRGAGGVPIDVVTGDEIPAGTVQSETFCSTDWIDEKRDAALDAED